MGWYRHPLVVSEHVSTLFVGLLLVVVGSLVASYARPLTDFTEKLDAIGSTNRVSETRAADWNVAITRNLGLLAAAVGVVFALIGVAGFF